MKLLDELKTLVIKAESSPNLESELFAVIEKFFLDAGYVKPVETPTNEQGAQ